MDKPMPEPTPVTKPFWDGLREHKVKIQYSPSAEKYIFYPDTLRVGMRVKPVFEDHPDEGVTLLKFTPA
jgi:hypothetical protein